jgi:hypothetical protein
MWNVRRTSRPTSVITDAEPRVQRERRHAAGHVQPGVWKRIAYAASQDAARITPSSAKMPSRTAVGGEPARRYPTRSPPGTALRAAEPAPRERGGRCQAVVRAGAAADAGASARPAARPTASIARASHPSRSRAAPARAPLPRVPPRLSGWSSTSRPRRRARARPSPRAGGGRARRRSARRHRAP